MNMKLKTFSLMWSKINPNMSVFAPRITNIYRSPLADGVGAWRPPGVPARDGFVLLLMMYSSSRLV